MLLIIRFEELAILLIAEGPLGSDDFLENGFRFGILNIGSLASLEPLKKELWRVSPDPPENGHQLELSCALTDCVMPQKRQMRINVRDFTYPLPLGDNPLLATSEAISEERDVRRPRKSNLRGRHLREFGKC